jgi:L-arabinose isomerase
MIDLANLEVWFVPGSQHLYGPEALKDVEEHSIAIAGALSASPHIPVKIVCKPVMTSSDSIHQLMPGCDWLEKLRGTDHLDAHLLSGPDVDRRPPAAEQTVPASPHTIQ